MIPMTATDRRRAPNARWIALVVVCMGSADVDPRLDDRQRRPARYPARPPFHPGIADLGAQRLPDHLRLVSAAVRPARRPDRAPSHVPDRRDPVHPRLRGVRPGPERVDARRRAVRPGSRRRRRGVGDRGDHHLRVPRPGGAGPARCRSTRWSSPAAASLGLLAGGAITDLLRLALDLLHQRADRDRHRDPRPDVAGREPRPRDQPRPRRARLGADHRRDDRARLRDRHRRLGRLGLGPTRSASARWGWRMGVAFVALESAAVQPDHAAAHLPHPRDWPRRASSAAC